MSVDRSDIEKVATLSRLAIDKETADQAVQKVNDILTMIDQMQAVDTDAVEPMTNPLDATQRLRADEVTEQDRREAFQAIAPSTEAGLFLVPKVIE
ncbi:MAG: Asp-tRNA(Asn)/Glu-tRNA(Gln) amidotransferase subunit GatC [Pseudomonadales bacterium]